MKINKKIKEINVDNFIEQYLKSCGIENVEGYLNPDLLFFDDPFDYVNINEAIQVFDYHVKNKSNVGILMD